MPNIVSNSWGGLMGGQTWFNSIIATWKKLGIIGVFAIGNSGQLGCSSAGSPGDQADIIAVGSTNMDSELSDFISRGPGRGPGITIRRKPEVAAPGRNIISADAKSNSTYITLSGTSMACPNGILTPDDLRPFMLKLLLYFSCWSHCIDDHLKLFLHLCHHPKGFGVQHSATKIKKYFWPH
jgi:hypothetical protein